MHPTVLAHSGAESDKSSVVECMDWQSAGTMLATGSMDGWVRVWNKSGQLAAHPDRSFWKYAAQSDVHDAGKQMGG